MDAPAWIGAVCAVVSLVAAGVAWWRANASKDAKRKAEDAEKRAAESLAAAKRSAESIERTEEQLRRLADQAQGPVLRAVAVGPDQWLMTNRRDEGIVVAEVLNREDCLRLDELNDGITIPPRSQHRFRIMDALGYPAPSNLHLRLGDGREIHVPLEPGP